MENYNNNIEPQQPQQELRVGPMSFYDIQGIAKWTKVIAVITIVMLSLYAIMTLMMAAKGIPGAMVQVISMLIMIAIYVYPLMKALGVSKKFKAAVNTNDSGEFTEGLSDMRSMMTYLGVLTIIGLVIIALVVILSIVALMAVDSYISDFRRF